MDMGNNYMLYLAIVSTKHKATDLIKVGTTFSMATSDADFQPSFIKQRYGVTDIIKAKYSVISVISTTVFGPQILIVR